MDHRDTFIPHCNGESAVKSTKTFTPNAFEQVLFQAPVAIPMVDLMEVSSLNNILYLTFLSETAVAVDSFCVLVPYGVGTGTGTGTGTGAGVLPGAKPLKPPGVCLCACISALNKTPKYVQRLISFFAYFFFSHEGSNTAVLWFCVAVGGAGGGVGIPLAAGGYQGQRQHFM